jgi:hypothetical protein
MTPGKITKVYCSARCRNAALKRRRRTAKLMEAVSPREALVLAVGWPGAGIKRAA